MNNRPRRIISRNWRPNWRHQNRFFIQDKGAQFGPYSGVLWYVLTVIKKRYLGVTSTVDQIRFSHRFGAEGGVIDGIYTYLNQYVPTTCSYPNTLNLDISLNFSPASSNGSTWGDVLSGGVPESGAVADELVSSANFRMLTPATTPMIGQPYNFQLGFDTPLPKLGFSVTTCTIATNGTLGEKSLEFMMDGCAIKLVQMSTTTSWYLGSRLNSFFVTLSLGSC